MIAETEQLEASARARIEGATTLDELRHAEHEVLGKRSALAALNQRLGALAPDERRQAGEAVNQTRSRLQGLANTRRQELESDDRAARLQAERLDLTEVPPAAVPGHLHVSTQTRD